MWKGDNCPDDSWLKQFKFKNFAYFYLICEKDLCEMLNVWQDAQHGLVYTTWNPKQEKCSEEI